MSGHGLHVPPGHYYSPIPSTEDVARALAHSHATGDTLPGIDMRRQQQWNLLEALAPITAQLDLVGGMGRGRFTLDNTWFTYADALFMAAIVTSLMPRRIVEVGCGYSSALLLDVLDTLPAQATELTFIEPEPTRLQGLASRQDLDGRLISARVQDVPLEVFTGLDKGDILTVDSSHVLKAGSDVQFLVDQVFPRLAAGVWVHVHDVFYPFEYPRSWLASGVAFNEAYVIRALLQGSAAMRIELFTDYALRFRREWLERHIPLALRQPFETGGIWLSITPQAE